MWGNTDVGRGESKSSALSAALAVDAGREGCWETVVEEVAGGGVERNRTEEANAKREGRSSIPVVVSELLVSAIAEVVEVEKEGEQSERVFGRSREGRRLDEQEAATEEAEPAIITSSTLREATTVVGRFMGAEITRVIAFLE